MYLSKTSIFDQSKLTHLLKIMVYQQWSFHRDKVEEKKAVQKKAFQSAPTLPTMFMLAMSMLIRLTNDAHADKTKNVYAHEKDAPDFPAIFQSQKVRKFIKHK